MSWFRKSGTLFTEPERGAAGGVGGQGKILGGPDVEVCLGRCVQGAGLGLRRLLRVEGEGNSRTRWGGGEAEGVSRGVSKGQDNSSWGKSGPQRPLMAPREYFSEGWVKA